MPASKAQLNILLVEPAYRAKYPPLGLMKISQYHKQKGDHVEFVKGLDPVKRDHPDKWDRIYVASLFTYDWSHTMSALKYYQGSVKDPVRQNLIVGGVMATLMASDIETEVPCRVVTQLLDHKGKLGYKDDAKIDALLPDYSILDQTDYTYPTSNAYFMYATRGCIRRCLFCAVHRIEPRFKHYLPIADQISKIDKKYGPKRDLILLDNNVLASRRFADIVREVRDAGFAAGATFAYKSRSGRKVAVHRRVDFNQGVDIRLLTEAKMELLSTIAIEPLRLAFDHIEDREEYESKVRLAVKYKVRRLSNYVLYNYEDKPEDLYERLLLNVDLNQTLETQLFSFPMRYVSLNSKDRLTTTPGNVGRHWNRKFLRAVQCILIPTYGAVTHRLDFFKAAFGENVSEFRKILLMPEDYIINRNTHQLDGSTERWWKEYHDLTTYQREEFLGLLLTHAFKRMNGASPSAPVVRLLEHYRRVHNPQLPLDYAPADSTRETLVRVAETPVSYASDFAVS